MRKLTRKPQSKHTLQEMLSLYDSDTLKGALRSFESGPGWQVLKAYAKLRQREFEVVALDMIRGNQTTQAAAHASGYAQACEDLTEKFVAELELMLGGGSQVVENPPPEN